MKIKFTPSDRQLIEMAFVRADYNINNRSDISLTEKIREVSRTERIHTELLYNIVPKQNTIKMKLDDDEFNNLIRLMEPVGSDDLLYERVFQGDKKLVAKYEKLYFKYIVMQNDMFDAT